MKYFTILILTFLTAPVFAQSNTFPSSGDVGIGTTSPLERLHLIVSSGLGSERLLIESTSQSGNAFLEIDAKANRRSGVIFSTAGTEAWTIGRSDSDEISGGKFYVATGHTGGTNSKLVIDTSGKVGIGTNSPSEKLTVNGNILLPYPGKIIQKRSNVTSEHITASHGQGSGWMVNAAYSGSNNPQHNATYTINAGTHNTSAGYLDFDGNARRWSFFLSAPSTGIGNSVEFINTFTIDNSEVWLSPTGTQSDFYMDNNGFVGIGTTDPEKKLTVAGTVKSREVIVEENTGADFVFEEGYDLPHLSELEAYIQANRHLPEIPTAGQMKEEGVKVGELQMKLLQKIEELTLYAIEQEKRDKKKDEIIRELIQRIEQLESKKESP